MQDSGREFGSVSNVWIKWFLLSAEHNMCTKPLGTLQLTLLLKCQLLMSSFAIQHIYAYVLFLKCYVFPPYKLIINKSKNLGETCSCRNVLWIMILSFNPAITLLTFWKFVCNPNPLHRWQLHDFNICLQHFTICKAMLYNLLIYSMYFYLTNESKI